MFNGTKVQIIFESIDLTKAKSTTTYTVDNYAIFVIFTYNSFVFSIINVTLAENIIHLSISCIMNKHLLSAIILFLLISCQQGNKKDQALLFEINVEEGINNKVDKLLLSDAAMDIDIIPLETTDSCLISRIRNLVLGENDLFINNFYTILRFDKTGKFRTVITKKGDAPANIAASSGLGIDDRAKLVHVANSFGFHNEIKTYRYDGTWVNTIHPARPGEALFGTMNWDERTYNFFNGKHIIRRILPLQDGSKDNWQIGILDVNGKVLAHFYDPKILRYQKEIDSNNSGQSIDRIRYAWGTESPVQNRYFNHVNFMFEANDTIYRYSEKNNTLKPRYVMQCGKRPDAEATYILGKESGYFQYIFAFDLLEAKDYLYIDVEKDRSAFLLRVDKQDGSIQSLELEGEIVDGAMTKYRKVDAPHFTNDLCGGLPFYPTSTNERQWLCAYNSFDLLEQIDIEKLKQTKVLLPEKRDQLVKILENLKDDDNPVVMVATLKY